MAKTIDDARISTGWLDNPKTIMLRRRLGDRGAEGLVSWLALILWTAANEPDGDLPDRDDEQIEIIARWNGEPRLFVKTLVGLKLLDGTENDYSIHDWAEHQPWAAGRKQRSAKAKAAAAAKYATQTNKDARSIPTASSEDAASTQLAAVEHPPFLSFPSPNQDQTHLSNEPPLDDSQRMLKADPLEIAAVNQVWTHYLASTERREKTYSLSPVRKRKGLARFRECLTIADGDHGKAVQLMNLCVDAMCASDWHMGRDPTSRGKKYIEWEDNLFSSREQMEKWWQRNDSA